MLLDSIYNVQPDSVEPDYSVLFRSLLSRRSAHSLIVLFSDLEGAAAERLRLAAPLVAGRHRLLVVSLLDPDDGTSSDKPILSALDVYRDIVRREREERLAAEILALERYGVQTLRLVPEQAGSRLLAAYLNQKLRAAI